MSEASEGLRYMNNMETNKKRRNLVESTQLLIDKGVKFTPKNKGYMLIIETDTNKYVFYPSSGIFLDKQNIKRQGVFTLLALLGK